MQCDYCNGSGLSRLQNEHFCTFCGGTGTLLSPQAELEAERKVQAFINRLMEERHRAKRGGEPKEPF